MVTQATGGVDVESLRRAYEQRDIDLMLGFYADDAELRIVNRLHPPSNPYELRGKEQIAEFQRRIFARDMKHRLEREVVGENRMAFHVACEYPSGERLLDAMVLELDNSGKIVRHLEVQAWDE
ncbi:MAG TPA: nuclear transport factor 2 family protein [Fimbriimonadaceae bacterium]|nr:nuclear transport factor 2 family protein [Fimbriimonadaceae bacterium]